MPSPLNHSQLEPFLRDMFAANSVKLVREILMRTAGGVVEEGGPLVDKNPGASPFPPEAHGHQTMGDVLRSATLVKTGFVWGKKSIAERPGVNNDLLRCADLALTYYTRVDFMMFDGIRTEAEQARHVKNGTSTTMDSKHLKGLAVDLVPIIGGVPKWDWIGCYEIACAMDKAATELGIANRITWGGAWDRTLADYHGEASAYAAAVEAYKIRHKGPDFIDGPHFEIKP